MFKADLLLWGDENIVCINYFCFQGTKTEIEEEEEDITVGESNNIVETHSAPEISNIEVKEEEAPHDKVNIEILLTQDFQWGSFYWQKSLLRIFCCRHHQMKRYICVKNKNVLGFIILCLLAKTFVLLLWLYDFFIGFWAFQKKLSTISSWIVFPYIQMPKLYFILHNESIQKYGFRCTILYQNFVCLKMPNSKYFYRIFTSGDQNFLNSIYQSLFNSGIILIMSEYFASRYSSVKKVEYSSSKRGKWWYCVLKFSSRF